VAARKRTVFPNRGIVAAARIVAVTAIGILPASASFHLFQINELYSDASGSVQFVELLEGFGGDGQNFLAGHTLSVTQATTTHTMTFPSDLPSASTARKHVLIATPAFAALGIVTPDYIIPAGFLFTSGATVNYAGVDSVGYGALPVDGVMSLNRDGTTGVNSPTNFAGQTGTINATPPAAVAGVPTLHGGAIAALSILLLVLARSQRIRARRRTGPG
jgi:serralysin